MDDEQFVWLAAKQTIEEFLGQFYGREAYESPETWAEVSRIRLVCDSGEVPPEDASDSMEDFSDEVLF